MVNTGAQFFAASRETVSNTITFAPPRVQARTAQSGGGGGASSFDASGVKTITATILTNGGGNTACDGSGGYGVNGALGSAVAISGAAGTANVCGVQASGVVATNAGASTTVFILAGTSTGALTSSTSTVASAFAGYQITVVTGGTSQTRIITGYTTGRQVTVHLAFSAAPVASESAYTVTSMGFATSGTVVSKTSNSIFKLATTATTDSSYYKGMSITIGAETKTITAYAANTRTVTISGAFVDASGTYYITEADTVANGGYAEAATVDTKTRTCSFPDMIIDAYGENYVLRYTVVMVNGNVYHLAAYTVDSNPIDVAGHAVEVLVTTEADGWIADAVPTTNGVIKMKDEAGTLITSDKLTGCCRATASIHTNHKGTYNAIANGALTVGTVEGFTSGVATYDAIKMDHYGLGYRLTYTPECSDSTETAQTTIKGATIAVQSASTLFDVEGQAHHIEVNHFMSGWVNDRANTNAVTVRVVNDGGGAANQPGSLLTDDDLSGVDRIQVTVTQRPQINDNKLAVASYAYDTAPAGDGATSYKDAAASKLTDGVLAGAHVVGGVSIGHYTSASVVGVPKATTLTVTFTLGAESYLNTATIGYIHAPSVSFEPHLSQLVFAPSQIVITTAPTSGVFSTGATLSTSGINPFKIDESCTTCTRNEITWTAARQKVKFVKMIFTGPSSGTYYMLDEIFFTSGYSGGAGTFSEYESAIALVVNGIATFSNLKFDRYCHECKWTYTANVPVPTQRAKVRAEVCPDATCNNAVQPAATHYVETATFPVDQLIYKRTLTLEKIAAA